MKTKTLSVLAVFALLSVNLVQGSVIKGNMKKNLVEAGVEEVLSAVGTVTYSDAPVGSGPGSGDCASLASGGLPPNQGAAEFMAISTGVLASSG
jgi:hypothetical protein